MGELDINDIKNIVVSVFKSKNLSTDFKVSYCVKNFSQKAVGFLGQHRVLEVLVDGDEKSWCLKFFMKSMPENSPGQSKYITEFRAFVKEISFFQLYIPKLKFYKIDFDNWAPRCFLARENSPLIMDDLTRKGYQPGAGKDGILDMNHLKVTLKAVAGLHTSSLLLEHKSGLNILEICPNACEENSYPDDETNLRTTSRRNCIKVLLAFISEIPEYNQHPQLNKILEEFASIIESIVQLVKPSKVYKNTVSHGDLWKNNIMFKYEESDNLKTNPISAKLVDYQLVRYSPPALDIMSVICLTTMIEFQKTHLGELIDEYCRYVREILYENDIKDPNALFDSNEIKSSCNHYNLYGQIETLLFSHLTLLPEDISTGMLKSSDDFITFISDGNKRVSVCLQAFRTNKHYRHKMRQVICYIIEQFILV